MTTALRKSARTLQHLVAVFGGPAWAVKSGKIEVQAAPVVPLKAKAPKTSSAPVCPACGTAAGIRETHDLLRGQTAGECMACGALRILD
jgi:hypothetical protein